MVYGCAVKSFAFVTALMSIAVLASSIAVLVSAVAYSRVDKDANNNTETRNSTIIPFSLPPTRHAGVVETAAEMNDENPPFVPPNMTMATKTTPLSTTTTTTASSRTPPNSVLLNEKVDKKNKTVELSTSMSPTSISSSNSSTTTSNKTTSVDPDSSTEDVDGSLEESSSDSTVVANPKSESWNASAFLENQHEFWETKSDTYIMLIQASAGTGIFAGLLQLVFSWLLICGMAKDLKDRTTIWNLSNLIVLILAVVIILIPLSYNNARDTFNEASVFWTEICNKIESVEFSKSLETFLNSISNFLAKDLAFYYYILGVDAFILLVLLIPPLLCCCCVYPCKRCCCKGKHEKSESDLMLFETGTGGYSASAPGLDRY